MPSNIDTAALRALAKAATPVLDDDLMRYDHGGGRLAILRDGTRKLIADFYGDGADREFYAAANPATILALLDQIASKDARIAELEAERDDQAQLVSDTEAVAMDFITEKHDWKSRATAAEAQVAERDAEIARLREAITASQAVLAEYIAPDSGISERAVVNDLLGILDHRDLVEMMRRAALSAPQQAGSETGPSQAALDVLAERRRQVEVEGWTAGHDDGHPVGDMARAAACYALAAAHYPTDDQWLLRFWPWLDIWWKPRDPRHNLVRAGALLLAEIERLDRMLAPAGSDGKGERG